MSRFNHILCAAVVAVSSFAAVSANASVNINIPAACSPQLSIDNLISNTPAVGNPVCVGMSTGGPITTIGSGFGTAGVSGYTTASFTISLTAIGSPALTNPNFGSNTLTVTSSGAGTITLYATETGDTALVPSFNLGFTNNGLSTASVTEAVYSSSTNNAYALTTLLGSATLLPNAATTVNAPFGLLAAPYSITEVYTINFGAAGVIDATILENANVPEPMSLSLLGAGLAGLGFVRLRRSPAATA